MGEPASGFVSGWLMALALVAALAAMGGRALRRKVRVRRAKAEPGRSPARPLRIATFHDLDDAAEAARCACGGELIRLGEGSRQTEVGLLRVLRCECAACEEEVDLFFDLSELRH